MDHDTIRVTLKDGVVVGRRTADKGHTTCAFLGLPYAAPPVGDLRWRLPQPVMPWEGERDATMPPMSSPQAKGKVQMDHDVPQSEDCLTVNVIAPEGHDGPLPVMVWLHGGALLHGNGNEPFFIAGRLPAKGVVVVTVNSRLGPLGLLSHPLLAGESPHGQGGNYLLFDLIAALRWVQENIFRFGGDRDRITIFGESGGGSKVLALMCAPQASGLFHRAIIESGGVFGTLNGRSPAEIEEYGERMFAVLGVADADDPLAAARALPWQAVIEADAQIVRERNLDPFRWDWTIDDYALLDTTEALLKSGRMPNIVPLIAGCNQGEIDGTGSPFITFPSLVPFCVEALDLAARRGLRSFAYLYDHVPEGWRRHGCVSYHRLECGYVFGDWDDSNGFFRSDSSQLAAISGAGDADPELGESDRTVSEIMMTTWTSFARDTQPVLPNGQCWPAYDRARDRYLFITREPEVRIGFSWVAGDPATIGRGNLSDEVARATL